MKQTDFECMTDAELNAYFSPEYIRKRSYAAQHRSINDLRRIYQAGLDSDDYCEQEWTFEQYVQACYHQNDDGTFYASDNAFEIESGMQFAHAKHTVGIDAYYDKWWSSLHDEHIMHYTNYRIGVEYYVSCASGKLNPELCPYTLYRDTLFQKREDGQGYDWRQNAFKNVQRLQAMVNDEIV